MKSYSNSAFIDERESNRIADKVLETIKAELPEDNRRLCVISVILEKVKYKTDCSTVNI